MKSARAEEHLFLLQTTAYDRMMDLGETAYRCGAEGDAKNSQAKGPDTGRYSGKQ